MIIGSDKSLLHNIFQFCTPRYMYCQTYIVSCTKSLNLNISCLVLQLSLPNPLKPGVNVIMVTTAVSGRLRLTFTMTVTGRLPFPFTTAVSSRPNPEVNNTEKHRRISTNHGYLWLLCGYDDVIDIQASKVQNFIFLWSNFSTKYQLCRHEYVERAI